MYPLNLMKSLTLTLFLDDRQFLIQLSFTKPFMARVKVDWYDGSDVSKKVFNIFKWFNQCVLLLLYYQLHKNLSSVECKYI